MIMSIQEQLPLDPSISNLTLRQPSSINSSLVTPTKDRERERERECRISARGSQHLQTAMPNANLTASSAARLGSRSPNSIPSSPTSVHSSSSAIFERDIEPITCPSPPHSSNSHPNPHRRTPRSKVNEQLDQSVPSVLDSAAELLASTQGTVEDDRISVVAPARDLGFGGGLRSGVTSPIGSLRSRSPSPIGVGAGRRTSLLLSIPSPPLQTNVPLVASNPPASSRAPANISTQTSPAAGCTVGEQPNLSTPSIVTPTSMYYSVASGGTTDGDGEGTSPTTTTLEHPPSSFLNTFPSQSYLQSISPAAFSAIPLNLSHPPSPIISPLLLSPGGDKRLSFMSYTDLLASTPASLQPLSSFTTSASSAEPPPHIPSVSGITQASAQAQAQLHSHSPLHSSGRSLMYAAGVIEGRGVGDTDSIDDAGGEWEREGLGSGLEERLEALLGLGSPGSPGIGVTAVGVLPMQVQGRA
jgi:hypothetical protein